MDDAQGLPPSQDSGEPVIPPSPAPPAPNGMFRGPHGIRAGWRALIFLAIMVALFVLLVAALKILGRGRVGMGVSQLTPLGLGVSEGTLLLFAVIAALIMSRIEQRKFGQFGLPVRFAFGKDFWIGTLVGFAAITSCLLGISLFHGFRITGSAIHGKTIASAALAWAAAFLVVGLDEEFVFRGYLQFTLTTGMGFWPTAILLSLLFGLAHAGNPGESPAGLASVVLFGLLFCLFLRRRGNLWWAVGFHAGWDWGQTFFYGVPDSGIAPYHSLFHSAFEGTRWLTGGTVGPEASVFTPVVLGIVAVIFASMYRENLYQVR
jgi:membrane protease YdiL (CAAX protease family)